MLFVVIVVAAFLFFATQFGAKESHFSTQTMVILLFVVGLVLYFLWTGTSVSLTTS
jgi:hypothetical protein